MKVWTILALIIGCLTFAQEANVYGVVLNEQGIPQRSVSISVNNRDIKTMTDAEGNYSISLPSGEHRLIFNKHNGSEQLEIVQLLAGESRQFDVILSDLVELEAVELFGTTLRPPEKLDQITRLPLKPSENIQTITTISNVVIEKQGILTISEAVRNAPGIYTYATFGNTSESIGGRGFRGIPVLKNGVRVHSDFRGRGFITEMQGIESVQVIKGAATISQGFGLDLGSAGGVINLVTKVPKFENSGNVGLRYGSWNQIRPHFDVNRVLISDQLAVRINGVYEGNDGYRDHNNANRFYVNPSVRWKPLEDLTLTMEMDYLSDKRTPDPGTVNLSPTNTTNMIYDLPVHQFLGFASNVSETNHLTYSATARYNINPNWYLNAGLYGSNLATDGNSTILGQIANSDGIFETPHIVNRSLNRTNWRKDKNQTAQIDVVMHEVYTGNFKHLAQVGADWRVSDADTKTFRASLIDQMNILSTDINNHLGEIPDFAETGNIDQRTTQIGMLAQYVVEYKKWARFFSGLRYSNFNDRNITGTLNRQTQIMEFTETQTQGNTWNPIFGLMVYAMPELAFFASYTNSTNPRSASRQDELGNALGNEVSNQFETGLKGEFLNGRLRFNTTYFRVANNNMIMQDVTTNDEGLLEFLPWYIKGGDDIRQGIEVDLSGRVLPEWEVMIGYSYLNAEYQNSTRFVDGSRPNNTPEHIANFWSNYTFAQGLLSGLNIGAGVYYVGERPYNDHVFTAFHGITPDLEPWNNKAYTTLNAQLGYQFSHFAIRLFANNITNNIGYNAYRNQFINRIDPRNFAVQVNYRF